VRSTCKPSESDFEPEGHRNSDHARDLPVHESVLVRTTHGLRGSNARDPLNPGFLSLKHSSLVWRALPQTRCGASQIVSQGCLHLTGRRSES